MTRKGNSWNFKWKLTHPYDDEFKGFTETYNISITVKTCVPFIWFEHFASLYNPR
jgi:hypothetical protein